MNIIIFLANDFSTLISLNPEIIWYILNKEAYLSVGIV